MMQKAAINHALTDQINLKKNLNSYAQEKSMHDELVKLKSLATQLERERQEQSMNEKITRATLKDSWERHAALKTVERRLNELENKV